MGFDLKSWRRWLAAASFLKYPIAVAVFVVVFPFTAFPEMPGHKLFGGLFLDLSAPQVGVVTLALMAAAWTLLFVTGLLVQGTEVGRDGGPYIRRQWLLPQAMCRHLGLPVSWGQVAGFSALALPGVAIVVGHSGQPVGAALAALFAVLAGALVFWATTFPVRLFYFDYYPFAFGRPIRVPWMPRWQRPIRWFSALPLVRRVIRYGHRPTGWPFSISGAWRPVACCLRRATPTIAVACWRRPGPTMPTSAFRRTARPRIACGCGISTAGCGPATYPLSFSTPA